VRQLLQFRASTVLLFVALYALGLAWWKDHQEQRQKILQGKLMCEVLRLARDDEMARLVPFCVLRGKSSSAELVSWRRVGCATRDFGSGRGRCVTAMSEALFALPMPRD
jgi:hypothetical protein